MLEFIDRKRRAVGTLRSQTAMGTLILSKYNEEEGIISLTYGDDARICKCMDYLLDTVERIEGIDDLQREGSTIMLIVSEEHRDELYKLGDRFLREVAQISIVEREFNETALVSAMAVSADVRSEH